MQLLTTPRSRTIVVDSLLAAVVTTVMVVGTFGASAGQVPPRHPVDGLTFVLIAVAAAGLLLRRVRPLVALAAATAPATAYLLIGYAYGPILFAVAITTYSSATVLPLRRSLAAWAVAAAVLLVPAAVDAGWNEPLLALAQLAAWASWSLAAWAVGTVVGGARDSARRTRAEQARQRAYEERLRTAQDVHDIVGHGLAAISMQAGVALHVLDRSPQQAREILETIKHSSQDALGELRTTLAGFRGSDEARVPRPGLDRLEDLVSRTVEAGLPVELIRNGERTALPSAVELAAYRIVQESLANVLRHAGPARATVRIEHGPEGLEVQIADTGRGRDTHSPDGQGLVGMRARAAAVGGSLEAGTAPGGGFLVRARLPVAGADR